MAFGSIVGATIARGRVAGIDAKAAQRMPGVLLVMTHENAPKQAPFQAKADDRHARPKPQLASDKVQYFGQPVALGRGRDGGDRARRRLRDRRHLREGRWRLRSRIGQRCCLQPRQGSDRRTGRQHARRFRQGVRRRAGEARCDLQDALPVARHDGAARQPRLVAGRQAHRHERPAAGRERPQVDRRHAEARTRQGRGDLRVCRRRLRRQAAGLWRRHPRGPGGARAQPSGARGADAPADVPCHDASAGLDPARPPGRRTRRHADRDHPPIAGAECAGR